MTSDPAAKDGRGHTRDFMPDECGSFQFTTSADAKRAEHMFNQLSSDNDRLRERVKELAKVVQIAYTILADVRHQWPGRHTAEGQGALVAMRDAIAKATGRDPQDVQDDAFLPKSPK